jgi:dUTP pyrophosphatase
LGLSLSEDTSDWGFSLFFHVLEVFMSFAIPTCILSHANNLPLPEYQTPGSAGMDLYAAIEEDIILSSLERCLVPTGLMMAIPRGYEAQIRPRSGLAWKHGISIPNSPGTIDSDYRGEIKVMLVNLSNNDFVISRGMRIAQMVIAAVVQMEIQVVDSLDQTKRGAGGFGSTGFVATDS